MKAKISKYLLLLIALFAVVATVNAQGVANDLAFESATAELVARPDLVLQDKNATGPDYYIVRLADNPLATYRGGVFGLTPTSPAVTGNELDMNAPESIAYLNYLDAQQASVIDAIAGIIDGTPAVRHQYSVAFNGMSVYLTPDQAAYVAGIPGVVTVTRNFARYTTTDVGPQWIGAPSIWDGSAVPGGTGTMGEGVLVGVIDTGINMDHPSFADIGGDGYDHDWTGDYLGWCDPADPDYDPALVCNDKLVGVRSYVSASNNPEDEDGHGSHTSSTSAGNMVNATMIAPTLAVTRDISGVAPHANIISYDGCTPNGCSLDALTASIDDAVADGVDVINYSIGGGSSDPWTDSDSLGFLAAFEAGVHVATSAGNGGPGPSTVGSPADAPWITTVGASTHNRLWTNSLVNMTSDGGPLADIVSVGFTSGYGPERFVYAGDFPNPNDPGGDPAQCLQPYPAGTFDGQIVVCDRGAIARVAKGQNVLAGGAGGFVLANLDAQGESVVGDAHFLPGVHIGDMDGDAVRDYIANNTNTMAEIGGAEESLDPTNGDIMAGFSSRGPNIQGDVIKPDVTNPGVSIWAAIHTVNAGDPAEYGFLSGTSMSSPHTAGSMALMDAVYPTWSPAEVRSALMMQADVTDNFKEDGVTPADPFDLGAGRVALNQAVQSDLVMNVTGQEYIDADPNMGGDPRDLNIASMQNSACVGACSFTRTVTNPTADTYDFAAILNLPAGMAGMVSPDTFTLASGESQELTIDIDVSGATPGWNFGELQIDNTTPAEDHNAYRLPIAIMPATGDVPDMMEIHTRRDAGQESISGTAIEITDLTIETFGLARANAEIVSLAEDPTNGDPYDNLDDVWHTLFTVPAGTVRMVAEITDSDAPDMDLFWGADTNGNGLPDAGEELGSSTTSSFIEYLNAENPAAGDYWILVQNWGGSGAVDDSSLYWGMVMGDAGNMMPTGPDAVPAGTPFDIDVNYDEETEDGEIWYGAFTVGTDAGNPGNVQFVNVDLHRLADDVSKSVDSATASVGDTVMFTIAIEPNVFGDPIAYNITDALPTGLTLVPGSATASDGMVMENGNTVTWDVVMSPPGFNYEVTTSDNDVACAMPLANSGAYTDLSAFGLAPDPGISGDGAAWTITAGGDPYQFFGTGYQDLTFSDDGWGQFGPYTPGANPGQHMPIPDSADPNNIFAVMWRDMEIVYDAGNNYGVTIAQLTSGGVPSASIVEYDDVVDRATGDTYDVEFFWNYGVDEGGPEFIYAYDNLTEANLADGSIGAENDTGTSGIQYAYNDIAVTNGMAICWDWTLVPGQGATMTFEATVDLDACFTLTNNADHVTDQPGAVTETASASVLVDVCDPTDVSLTAFDGGTVANWMPLVAAVVATMVAGVVILRRREA